MAKKATTPRKRRSKLTKVIEANPFVTSTWAEYAEEFLKPKYIVYRFDDNTGNRFYYFIPEKEVEIASGITTMVEKVSCAEERKPIAKWKELNPDWRHLLNISAEYGTTGHIVYGEIMFKKGVDLAKLELMQKISTGHGNSKNMPSKDILSFLKFMEDYNLVPLLIEASLVYRDPDTGKYLAMTIDLLAKMQVVTKEKTQVEDGVYSRGPRKGEVKYKDVVTETIEEKILIVDFKGNFFGKDRKDFYEGNKLQLQGAKLAVEQNFDIKVDDVYNYAPNAWRTAPTYTFYKWDLTAKDWDVFFTYWHLAQLKGYNEPVGNILVTEGFKNSSDYKLLSYKEYVTDVLLKEKEK